MAKALPSVGGHGSSATTQQRAFANVGGKPVAGVLQVPGVDLSANMPALSSRVSTAEALVLLEREREARAHDVALLSSMLTNEQSARAALEARLRSIEGRRDRRGSESSVDFSQVLQFGDEPARAVVGANAQGSPVLGSTAPARRTVMRARRRGSRSAGPGKS